MTTAAESDIRSKNWALPQSLTEWFSPESLWSMALEDIETLDWQNPQIVSLSRDRPAYQPKFLLGLLTCTYLCGIFRSHDIVRHCRENQAWQSILGDRVLNPKELSRFRRENRGLLKSCMVQLLKRALQKKYGLVGVLLPAGFKTMLVDDSVARLEMARHMDRDEI